MKEGRGLVITFVKRIFQTSLPVSMTLIHNKMKSEDQLLIADTKMKFKLFDKNTFEILATFLGPIYDSYVERFVSIYETAIQIDFQWNFGLKVPLNFSQSQGHNSSNFPRFYLRTQDAGTSSFGPTPHSKLFVFSTNKHICLFALPIDGNPFRSLGIVGHCNGIKHVKMDSRRRLLFTVGHKCQSLFMWKINYR